MSEIRILHLSDIHIGEIENTGFKHYFRNGDFPEKIVSVLKETKTVIISDDPNKPTDLFLVISGDLVCNGAISGDYEDSFQKVENLRNNLNISRERIIIVPGNHDLNRDDHSNPLKHYFDSHNKYFKDTELLLNEGFGKSNSFSKTKWVYEYSENQVVFIPLYSAYPEAKYLPDLIKNKFLGSEYKDKPWLFDRGLISGKQLDSVKKELDDNNDVLKDFTKIAIFHHNPLPVTRPCVNTDDYDFPDICLLANGPEVLSRLCGMGVNVVLHGHAHQNSIHYHVDNNKEHSLIVLGAPSVGCANGGVPWGPQANLLGFNHVTIITSSTFPKIKLDRFSSDASHGVTVFKKENEGGSLFLETAPLIRKKLDTAVSREHFVNFDEGIKLLSELIFGRNTQGFLLNYSDGTKWDDCFEKIWGEILLKEEVINGISAKFRISACEVKQLIQMALNEKTYTEPLITKFRADRISNEILEQLPNNPHSRDKFTTHIVTEIKKEQSLDARDANYFVEILRCVLDQHFKLKKGIYLKPDDSNKYEWLCNSILAARNLKNFNIAWLPFGIRGYDGKSLVAGLDEDDKLDKSIVTVLVGYNNPVPGNKDKLEKTVFYLPGNASLHTETGLLYSNLNALMRKIIVPLSERILDDFPLYKDGRLYFDNLKFLANTYKYVGAWEIYKKQFKNNFENRIAEDQKITKEKIENLYKWVANVSKGIAVPWNKKDYEYLQKI